MRSVLVLAIALASSCASPPPPSEIYGVVHVHQFAGGAHPGAEFLAQPIAAADVDGDELGPPVLPIVMTDGACTLTLPSSAAPPAQPAQADDGLVRITGGRALGQVELAIDPESGVYAPLANQGATIFAGGETLTMEGAGAQAPPFRGQLATPPSLALTKPVLQLAALPTEIAWTPAHASRIEATLVVSQPTGAFAIVTCDSADEAGALAFPPSLLARVPAPPRDLQLQVSRDQFAYGRAPDGARGVVLHAGWEVNVQGHED